MPFAMRRTLLAFALAAPAALLCGCDMLGIESPEKIAAARSGVRVTRSLSRRPRGGATLNFSAAAPK